jgi:hypothetical protein
MFSQIPAAQGYPPATIAQGSRKRSRSKSMEITETIPVSQSIRQITRFSGTSRKRRAINQIHSFKRTFDYGSSGIVTDGVNPTYSAFNFSMNDMPGYTELTNLFDFYKLTGVLFQCIPYKQTDSNSVGGTNNTFQSPIFYAIDRSDSTTPTSVAEILEYNDHKITTVWKGFKCFISNPKFSDATAAVRGGWVGTSNPSLNWYGLKLAIPPTNVATTFYVVITYYVKCKDPK